MDNSVGFMVLHPDTLISGTVVSDSISCIRRSVLSNRVKFATDRSTALLYGCMLHEVFQMGLLGGFEEEKVEEYAREVIGKSMEDLWCLGESESVALAQLQEMVPRFREWASSYLGDSPSVCGKRKGSSRLHRSKSGFRRMGS